MYPTKKLWEVCELIMWQSPKSETYNSEWIGLPFFQWKKEFWEIFPTPEIFCSQPIKIAEKWDILISVRAPVGPTNIANEKCCIWRWLWAIRARENFILSKYVLKFLKKFEKEISELWKWSTFSSITKADLENLPIPLPPLSTQKLIVDKLDMIFAEIEKSKNLLEKNLQNVDEMNKSVLEKIFANDKWERKKLWEVCEIKKWKKVNYAEQWKYNYIDIGILRTNIIEQYTNDEWVFCNKNDILIAWDGSKSGTVGFWLEWVIGSTLAKITIDTKMFSSEFIGKFLQGNFDYLNKNTSGAAIPHLRKDILINLEIPLPPLPEQQKIVEYLDNIFAGNKKLKTLYETQIKNLSEMKQSFLKKAFAGELV